MATRRRVVTRDELLGMLAEKGVDRDEAGRVLQALDELGAELDPQIRVAVDEPLG